MTYKRKSVPAICLQCKANFDARVDKIEQGRGKFCSYKCSRLAQVGDNNPNWKGGISTNAYHYKKDQVSRYPERVSARKKVAYALKTGKLTKTACVNCGATEDIQAHHHDYSKPLDIIWLCRNCHRNI